MDVVAGMPTILRDGPYRYFFYASDSDEPPHVHVERDDRIAKIWLGPARLSSSGGYRRPEIIRILSIAKLHEQEFTEAWHEFFSGSD